MNPGLQAPQICTMGGMLTATQGELATYALGSCVGVAAWDPATRWGGMLHFMLPDSSINPERAARQAGVFADTGLRALWDALNALGLNHRRLRYHLAGGAQTMACGDYFAIGRRNLAAAKGLFWKEGIFWEASDCGGSASRKLSLDLQCGKVWVTESSHGGTYAL